MGEKGQTCRHYGDAPGCLRRADPYYTMDFGDVEPGAKIFWCSACGPRAEKLNEAIEAAFATRPNFQVEFQAAIEDAEQLDG